jgi:hypothetical protein
MSIAGAIYEGSLARAGSRTLEQERLERDRQLRDFEDLLESVEAQNLETQRGLPARVLEAIAELERVTAVPAPAAVWSARTAARLHDALLSWQGALLDALRPHRLDFGDRFD